MIKMKEELKNIPKELKFKPLGRCHGCRCLVFRWQEYIIREDKFYHWECRFIQ